MTKPSELSVKVNQQLAMFLADPVANGMHIAGHDLAFNVTPQDDGGGPYNLYTIAIDTQVMGGIYVPDNLKSTKEVMFDVLGLPVRMDRETLTRLNNFLNLMVLAGNRLGILDHADPVENPALVLVTKEQLNEAGLFVQSKKRS